MTDLLARLASAPEGSRVTWCTKCGFVSLQPPGRRTQSVCLTDVKNDCRLEIQCGTPKECIAAIKARGGEGMKLSEVLGVNALAICDCGHVAFKVRLRVIGAENHIRVIECDSCGHQLAVPFQANVDAEAKG